MHKLNNKTLSALDDIPNHAQKIIHDIVAYLLEDDQHGEDYIIARTERFIQIIVLHYEDVMPEIEMLHSRIFENQWEDDNSHFREHLLEIIDTIIEDYRSQ